jgi:dCTP diphosphatase
MTDSIKELTSEISAFTSARQWHQNVTDHRGMAISICLEAAELLEHFQWMDGQTNEERAQHRREDISDELADVAIYVLQLADKMDIDLAMAIREKMKKNGEKYPIK